MKYLYIFCFLFTYAICTAQDPELLDREWFLNELIINGESFPRTPNVDGSAFFYEVEMFTGHSMCEGGIGGSISYSGSNIFEIFEVIMLIDTGCNPDATAFMNRHHSFYAVFENNPFDYMIETNGDAFSLTVTNVNGDQAIYGTQPILAVGGFDENSIAVYPNPAINELFLNSKSTVGNLKVKIFNIEGKLLSNQNFKFEKQASLAISQLSSGMYFLNIEDINGNTEMKKFIKE